MTDKEYIAYAKNQINDLKEQRDKYKARIMVLESDLINQDKMLKENKNRFKEYEKQLEEKNKKIFELERKLERYERN